MDNQNKLVALALLVITLLVLLSMKNSYVALIIAFLILLSVINFHFKLGVHRLFFILFITFSMSFNILKYDMGIIIVISLTFIYFIYYLLYKNQSQNSNLFAVYLFFIIWFAYALIQLVYSETTTRSLNHIQTFIIGISIIWIISQEVNTKSRLKVLYNLWGFAVFFTILTGWWETLTRKHLPISRANIEDIGNVVTAGFFNPNDFSFFLIISFPIILYWLKKELIYKFLGIFMLVSSFYFHYMNDARAILLVYFICLSIFLVKLIKNNKKYLVFFIFGITFIAIWLRNEILISLNSIITLSQSGESINIRRELTESAWQIFINNPFGVGPGKLETHMPIHDQNVHNFWLEILVNYGWVTFLGLIMFFGVTLFKLITVGKELKELLRPILWSIIIFIPTCIIPSSIFQFNITWFLFSVMICAINIIHINKYSIYNKMT